MPPTSRFSFLPAGIGASCFVVLLGLTGLVLPAAVHAAPDTVSPADTFSVELVAYNTNDFSGNIYAIQSNLTPVFGLAQAYPNAALGGQTLTVSSSESVSNGAVTDTITISVPTNFVPTGTLDNHKNLINAITFSIGVYQGGTDPLDFTLPLSNPVSSGTATISPMGVTSTIPIPQQNAVLSNGNMSYSNEEGVFIPLTAMTSISFDQVTSFTFTITNVPEPSTTAALVIGAVGMGRMTFRRRRSACA